ncbi:MAG: GntR family transcriptional regulator [Deltaproteobacteria bacterium]|nr:GntR family transcriptional regulator [Deltaproteobacteria bacterium]
MTTLRQNKDKKNLAEKARQEIENKILAGGLRPDHHIIEAELADQLGISRTPLREALRQLEIKGLLKKRHSVGYTVVYHSPQDIRNTFEVRMSLESTAIRLACEKASHEHIERAASFLVRFDEALATQSKSIKNGLLHSFSYPDADHDWNSFFHKEIYRASGNELLTTYIMNLRDLDRLKRITLGVTLEDLLAFQSQHHKILDALKQRHKSKAVRAVQTHIKNVYDVYYQLA